MKKRIWELDALRGLLILGMVFVHLIYDMQTFLGLNILTQSRLFFFLSDWGGALFFLLSGVCVTLGSHPIRRGLLVVLCGLVVSGVTWGMVALSLADKGLIIYFGVLHCLGTCMLLWPLFRHLPRWLLALLAVGMIGWGIYLDGMRFDCSMWLMPLGFKPLGFSSSDYFALLPFLGFFLMGAVLGGWLYPEKKTLFPKADPLKLPIRILSKIGQWSLWIYMLHQPVLTGIVTLLEVIK